MLGTEFLNMRLIVTPKRKVYFRQGGSEDSARKVSAQSLSARVDRKAERGRDYKPFLTKMYVTKKLYGKI
mgnify:CR=1 FL=1